MTYNKWPIIKVYDLISFDICTHLQNNHLNQDQELANRSLQTRATACLEKRLSHSFNYFLSVAVLMMQWQS